MPQHERDAVAALAAAMESAGMGSWTDWQPGAEGLEARARLEHDPGTTLEDSGDWYGALAELERRVRGWYRDEWTYCGVMVEVKGPPCGLCGERKVERASLGGIESDAGGYFAEVLRQLVTEACDNLPAVVTP